nr:hypothetical protein [Edaphobacter sp.]
MKVSAGYTSNAVGFGWTNGVYLQMSDLISHSKNKVTTSH